MKKTFVLFLFPIWLYSQEIDSIKIAKIFHNQKGTLVLYGQQKEKYFVYNKERAEERFLPASTFKIMNSLIALQLKIIPDENYIFKWDGIKYENKNWNKDHNLNSALKYSVVPIFRNIAKEIGKKNYEKYLDAVSYGNCVVGEDTTGFWLDNSLKISAMEQVIFIKRFYKYQLPFNKEVIDLLKKLLPTQKIKDKLIHYKTGTGRNENNKWILWNVGYCETEKNVYYFAFNIEEDNFDNGIKKREIITKKLFESLIISDSK
ncbi:penicillin-binding transpeptidase domain-containing protein [Stygiobacter electus]|jgi:beta-lactamase class D|uniref:beta-lactamase n=1 Tax=Stygiobacter electus TaxID=3032292 RepID=A0AAE3P3M2_9BACT|nr:penicillin-binding transpeptidase domain-containing protein [Stygiobacter electus]MDF1612548.1 penicillin-binding transpeptidase domain-containing protein [Stygiobacter electus]